MRLFVKSLQIGTGVVAVLATGLLVGWWNTSVPMARLPTTGTSRQTTEESAVPLPPLVAQVGRLPPRVAGEAVAPAPLTNWEENVEAILNSPTRQEQKTAALLEIFPRLPESGQAEVAATLAPMLPDARFAELGQYLTNGTTAEPVMDVLLSGLLSRPDAIKLPWLLEIARNQGNPRSPDAVYLLQTMLDQDNGRNWALWQASVERFLQDSHP